MKERSKFSSKLGFILAAAGSAVGLGNIWRFPYLAAKYGGGIFLVVYLILVLTFGYTMIMAESSIGRMTRKSPLGAFRFFGKTVQLNIGGWLNSVIPILIVSYYSVIGGWVFKYLFEYLRGSVSALATDTYFTQFLQNGISVEFWSLIFAGLTMFIILMGVQNGIEKVSKILMPVLVILTIIVSAYSVTRPGALKGVYYFLVPQVKNFSIMTIVSAMGQMFYSLSIAMGIFYTFGSYMPSSHDIESATTNVEIFDSFIAILAGLMVIPAVFAFSGGDSSALQAGPSLMFITLPKVFNSMGFGQIFGILFFVLVLLAALTSSIALAEAGVATFVDEYHMSRKKAVLIVTALIVGFGSLSALGFSVFKNVTILGMGILDFFDFLTNSVCMPIAALFTCYLVVKVIKVENLTKEIKKSSKFKREKIFSVMIRYIAPIFLVLILITSILNVFGIINI